MSIANICLIRKIVAENLGKKFGGYSCKREPGSDDTPFYICNSTDWTVKITYWTINEEDSDIQSDWDYCDSTVDIYFYERDYKDRIDIILSEIKTDKTEILSGQGKLDTIRNYLKESLQREIPEWTSDNILDFGKRLAICYNDKVSFNTRMTDCDCHVLIEICGLKNPEKNLEFLKNSIRRIRKVLAT